MKKNNDLPEGKKRVALSVDSQIWEEIQSYRKKAGMPQNWLSTAINEFLPGLLAVVKQAEKDAVERKNMTEEEAMKRYEDLMRKELQKK